MADAPDGFSLVPAYDENGNETGYYTREPDGVSGMSVSALSELCGLAAGSTTAVSTLLTKIEDSDPETNDLSDVLKPFAGKHLRLETNDPTGMLIITDEVCSSVLEHYAFEARQYEGKSTALQNYRASSRAGMRVFIWSQTGYVPEFLRPQLKSYTTVYIQRLENIRDHDIPSDAWTTFRESAEILLLVEKEMRVPVDQLDLCDGSIGRHWSEYRKNKPWAKPVGTYRHVFRDQRGDRFPKAYDLSELSYFRIWLGDVYIPHHLPKYLADKHGKLAVKEIYEDMGGVTARVLEVIEIKQMTSKQQDLYAQFQAARQKLLSS